MTNNVAKLINSVIDDRAARTKLERLLHVDSAELGRMTWLPDSVFRRRYASFMAARGLLSFSELEAYIKKVVAHE